MAEVRNFKAEYDAFMQENPYRTVEINGVRAKYIIGGRQDRPVIVFFHGLEMQEMWIRYADYFQKDYGFLIYEYPLHTTVLDEQAVFLNTLLERLKIDRVILIGASDGGIHAQLFAQKYPEKILGMILLTTLTLDSDYVRALKKELWYKPLLLFIFRHVKAEKMMSILLKRVTAYLACETPLDQEYGRTFFGVITSDRHYKKKFIHSTECLYDLLHYEVFTEQAFEYLRGKVQIILPENDIFSKEDQARLTDFFCKLDARVINMPGGHLGCVVQAESYIGRIHDFLIDRKM